MDKQKYPAAGISTILIDAGGAFGTCSWVLQSLFMHHQPSALLSTSLHHVVQNNKKDLKVQEWRNGGTVTYGKKWGNPSEMLAVSVTRSNKGGILVKAANFGDATCLMYITLEDWNEEDTAYEATLSWVSGEKPTDVNTMETPRRVSIQQRSAPIDPKSGTVELSLRPFSVGALEFSQI